MATHPRLVNKQFNSPIGLYSEQNIREVLHKESQILSNGAVGINFHNAGVGKPTNLQNSAVLRMLEEEEYRQRNENSASNEYVPKSLREQIKWPPPEYERQHVHRSTFKDVVIPGTKRVTWPPPESEIFIEQESVHSQGGPEYPTQTPGLQNTHVPVQNPVPINPSYQTPLKPLNVSVGQTSPNYRQSPVSPGLNQSPSGFRPATPSKQWAPVHSPVSTPTKSVQPSFSPQQYQSVPQQYQPVPQQYQTPSPYQPSPQQYQAPPQHFNQPSRQLPAQAIAAPSQAAPHQQYSAPAYKPVEPPPSTITLRPQAPVSQAPPPVFSSQPATATLRGGKHLRGDLKWPPESVKKQTEEENRLRIELAKGPACRPRKVKKDYTGFFAQHALNSSYPGYKAPPGTQFYDN